MEGLFSAWFHVLIFFSRIRRYKFIFHRDIEANLRSRRVMSDWRLWNRGRGPELPDLAARNIPRQWNGNTRVTYHHSLRPGRNGGESPRGGASNDEIPEMGDLERAAKMLRLPDNPVDVRKRDVQDRSGRAMTSSRSANGGRAFDSPASGRRRNVNVVCTQEFAAKSEEEDWNGSSFCPARFHPKSVMQVVQANMKKYHESSRDIVGGRGGRPLDPHGLFSDLKDDPTKEMAMQLYQDPLGYPKW